MTSRHADGPLGPRKRGQHKPHGYSPRLADEIDRNRGRSKWADEVAKRVTLRRERMQRRSPEPRQASEAVPKSG